MSVIGYRGSGRTTTLAEVTVDTDGNFTISEYTDFLSSSVLVTGAVLISTGPCSVEGMVITVNASIQEVDAGTCVGIPSMHQSITTPQNASTYHNTQLPYLTLSKISKLSRQRCSVCGLRLIFWLLWKICK